MRPPSGPWARIAGSHAANQAGVSVWAGDAERNRPTKTPTAAKKRLNAYFADLDVCRGNVRAPRSSSSLSACATSSEGLMARARASFAMVVMVG